MDLGQFILRMTQIVRQRPSSQWLYAVAGVAVVIAICVIVEGMGWWPDWLRIERGPRIPMLR